MTIPTWKSEEEICDDLQELFLSKKISFLGDDFVNRTDLTVKREVPLKNSGRIDFEIIEKYNHQNYGPCELHTFAEVKITLSAHDEKQLFQYFWCPDIKSGVLPGDDESITSKFVVIYRFADLDVIYTDIGTVFGFLKLSYDENKNILINPDKGLKTLARAQFSERARVMRTTGLEAKRL